jgi:DNA-directed RNA polymerase subunit RPC12/RpoP
MSLDQKSPHRKVTLKTIAAPRIGAVVSAPPVLNASDHTVEYTCGTCATVLLHAEAGQVHNLTIRCTKCGSYNSTDVE